MPAAHQNVVSVCLEDRQEKLSFTASANVRVVDDDNVALFQFVFSRQIGQEVILRVFRPRQNIPGIQKQQIDPAFKFPQKFQAVTPYDFAVTILTKTFFGKQNYPETDVRRVNPRARQTPVNGRMPVITAFGMDLLYGMIHRLPHAADIVIDTGAPIEDAIVDIKGWSRPVSGSSTVLAMIMMHELIARSAQKLADRGIELPVFASPTIAGVTLHDTDVIYGIYRERMIEALYALNADLGIVSSLRDKGITARDVEGLVDGAAKVTRLLDNNPRPMTRSDMHAIYERLL